MHYRNDDNCCTLHQKIYTERKSMNDSAPCVPMNVWIHQRGFGDSCKRRLHFVEEFMP